MEFGRHKKKKIYIGIIVCIVYFAFNNRAVHMGTAFIENVCIVLTFSSLSSEHFPSQRPDGQGLERVTDFRQPRTDGEGVKIS